MKALLKEVNVMKKSLILLLIVLLMFSFTSCKRAPIDNITETAAPYSEPEQSAETVDDEVTPKAPVNTVQDDSVEITEPPAEPEDTADDTKTDEIKNDEVKNEEVKTEPPTAEQPKKEAMGYGMCGIGPAPIMKDLIAESTLIAVCDYIEPAYYIQTNNVPSRIHTEHRIKIVEILRGECDGEEITVRTLGGAIGGTSLHNSNEPKFVKGNRYILFLKAEKSFENGIECESYVVVGSDEGVMKISTEQNIIPDMYKFSFEVPDDETVFVPNLTSYHSSYGLTPLSMDNLESPSSDVSIILGDFRKMMEELNVSIPVNENYSRDQLLERYKERLDAGEITVEEYDKIAGKEPQYETVTLRERINNE